MPIYPFVAQDGERLEIEAEMRDAPGDRVVRDGKVFRRQYSEVQVAVKDAQTPTRVGSRSLTRWWPFHNRYDSMGRCLFENQRERDEAHAKAAHAGEVLTKADLSQPGQQRGIIVDD